MTPLGVLDAALVGALVLVAAVAVLVPRRAAATSAFLIFGILLAVMWGRIDAPDVAMAEAALGGGVAGALLTDALERRLPPRPAGERRPPLILLSCLVGAVVLAALVVVMRQLPAAPAELGPLALDAVDRSGVTHPITAVLLNYRSLDTLLEIAVVVIAAYGAGAVARERVRPLPPAEPVRRTLAVLLLPVLLVLAGWLLVAGTTQPGGAFQSGAILGAALVIAHLCGIPYTTPRGRAGAVIIGVGVLAFIALGAIGLATSGTWLQLDPAWAGAAILTIEAVLAVSIGVALAMIFLAAGARDTQPRSEGAA